MCNFHAAVALRAATDPVTGAVHEGHRAIIRVALSRYWAQRYLPEAASIDGYNPYPLATKAQQDTFARSGLARPAADVEREEREGIEHLRRKIVELELTMDLSPKALGLPVAPAREAFYNRAIDDFYTGDPNGDFQLVKSAPRRDMIPLHKAVAYFHADPVTSEVLETLVRGKICTLYTEAPRQVRRALVDTYEALPDRMKDLLSTAGKYGGNILMGGFSGIIGHSVHYGSVLGAGMAAGTASSLNFALSGAFLVASYGGWHEFFGGRFKAGREKLNAFAVQAGLTAAIAIGAQYALGHNDHDHTHMSMDKAQWLASLPPALKEAQLSETKIMLSSLPESLRIKAEEKARAENLSVEEYMLTCSGNDPVSSEIFRFLKDRASRPAETAVNDSPAPRM